MIKGNALRNSILLPLLLLGVLAVPVYSYASTDAGATSTAIESTAVEPLLEVAGPEASVQADHRAPTATPAVTSRTSLDTLSSEILNILIPLFVTAIGVLATMLLAWVGKKAKIDINEKRMHQWSMIAQMAAGRAGEWARNKAKHLTEDETVPGPDMLEVGVSWGLEYGIAHGLPDIGRKKLEGLLESSLYFDRNE